MVPRSANWREKGMARKGYGEKRVWRKKGYGEKKGMVKKRVWRKKGYGEKKGMAKNERAPRWTNMTNPAIHPEAGPFKEPRCVHCQYIPSSPVRVRREPPGFLHLTACPRYISHPVPPNFLARRRRPVLPPRPEYPALPNHPSRPLTLPPKARGREDPSPSPPPPLTPMGGRPQESPSTGESKRARPAPCPP
jgi:hypothetical protein